MVAQKVTVERAAEILGVSKLTVRIGMENKEFPIGAVIHQGGNARKFYHISPYLLSQYTGLPVEEIMSENT